MGGAGSGPGAWRWTLQSGPGVIDAHSGVYTARVRATLLADAAVWGEATVALLPLPFLPFDLVTKVQGQDWVVPFSAALPFLDLETGARPVKGKVQVQPPEFPSWEVWAGYGIPFTFPWKSHCGAQGELLSCREGSEVIRRDVTSPGAASRAFASWRA